MNKALTIAVFVTIGILSGCSKSYTIILAYKVKSIMPKNVLELSNGKKVSFFGIKFKDNKREEAKRFIEQLTLGSRVVPLADLDSDSVVFTEDVTPVYIYLWGSEKGNKMAGNSEIEKRGFLNVKVGFWNVQKGVGVNLNALLIKYGYADADMDKNYKHRDYFIALEKERK